MANSKELYAVDDTDRFLELNMHYLTRHLIANKFFTWLRSQQVFNQSDEEEVMNQPTTFSRAGKLIDTVKTRGRAGFNAFMEVLEYEYPESFQHVYDKRKPRPPPPEWAPMSHSRLSLEIEMRLTELLGKCVQKLNDRKLEVTQMETMINKLKEERLKKDDEDTYIDCLKHEVSELNHKLKQLQQNIDSLTDDYRKACEEKETIRKAKDEYMAQVRELQEKITEISQDLQRTQGKVIEQQKSSIKYKASHDKLRNTSDKDRHKTVTASDEGMVAELLKLGEQLTTLEKVKEEVACERDQLEQQLKEMQDRCTKVTEAKQQNREQIIKVISERDQETQMCQSLRTQLSALQAQNQKLEKDNKFYISKMAEREDEIKKMHRVVQVTSSSSDGATLSRLHVVPGLRNPPGQEQRNHRGPSECHNTKSW